MPHFCHCGSDNYICQRCGKIFCDNRRCFNYRDSQWIQVRPLPSIRKGNVCDGCQTPREKMPTIVSKEIVIDAQEFETLVNRTIELVNLIDKQFVERGWAGVPVPVYEAVMNLRVPLVKARVMLGSDPDGDTVARQTQTDIDREEYEAILESQQARRDYLDSLDTKEEF